MGEEGVKERSSPPFRVI